MTNFLVYLLIGHLVIPAEAGKQLAHASVGGILHPEVRRAQPVRYWSYTLVPLLYVAWIIVGVLTTLDALF